MHVLLLAVAVCEEESKQLNKQQGGRGASSVCFFQLFSSCCFAAFCHWALGLSCSLCALCTLLHLVLLAEAWQCTASAAMTGEEEGEVKLLLLSGWERVELLALWRSVVVEHSQQTKSEALVDTQKERGSSRLLLLLPSHSTLLPFLFLAHNAWQCHNTVLVVKADVYQEHEVKVLHSFNFLALRSDRDKNSVRTARNKR